MAKRTKDIDTLFDEIKIQMAEQIEANNKAKIENLEKENDNLREINNKLLKAVKKADTVQENFNLMNLLVDNIKSRIDHAEGFEEQTKVVYEFLSCVFTKDFVENTYDTPLWLGCLVQYYSNKDTIIEILKVLGFKLPQNIESFRLPQDWTEEELDIVFNTMGKHIVCNNQTYEENLRFWKPYALDSVKTVCNTSTYSEIPWQFLLRNPNLKKEKYLKKIGEMSTKQEYISGWRYLFKIDKYQELTQDELITIIAGIDAIEFTPKHDKVNDFLLRHLELVINDTILEKLYDKYKGSYTFEVNKCIFKMPIKYIEDYAVHKDNPFEWLKRNKELLTTEQTKKLLESIIKHANKEFDI